MTQLDKWICLFYLLWCIYLMFERQIYLKLVGVFVPMQFISKSLLIMWSILNNQLWLHRLSMSFYQIVLLLFPLYSLCLFVISFFFLPVFMYLCLNIFLSFCLLFRHLSSYRFIFVQFHLPFLLSFTGRSWAVVLDGIRSSEVILGKTSTEKKRFLSGIARIRGGGGLPMMPEFLALFQEVRFWSI